ncbi:hypothetical protein QWZ13_14140 [Reinekea marina]|nr:hypothetical protein [Reinekea marina]MDN3650056.1 hypothetical protein [Reinekea marina]
MVLNKHRQWTRKTCATAVSVTGRKPFETIECSLYLNLALLV